MDKKLLHKKIKPESMLLATVFRLLMAAFLLVFAITSFAWFISKIPPSTDSATITAKGQNESIYVAAVCNLGSKPTVYHKDTAVFPKILIPGDIAYISMYFSTSVNSSNIMTVTIDHIPDWLTPFYDRVNIANVNTFTKVDDMTATLSVAAMQPATVSNVVKNENSLMFDVTLSPDYKSYPGETIEVPLFFNDTALNQNSVEFDQLALKCAVIEKEQ